MTKLRGIRDNLFIALNGRNWTEMMTNLGSQLEEPHVATFHRGARLWLEAAGCPPDPSELERLVWLLEMHELKLEWWKDAEETSEQTPAVHKTDLNLAEKAESVQSETEPENHGSELLHQEGQSLWREAAFVSRTLRSGQMVRYQGTVVILGDVNPGAVIVADGNVIVWGRLRGVVHAGAAGDDKAVVSALQLAPTQLRIGGHVARSPELNKDSAGLAELARVRAGRIVIENWDDGKV